jgi:hypothetical protein
MPTDHFRYDLRAQRALRGMVQGVLAETAKNGLPGEHHFYVSFDTRAPGVQISPRLREKYPDEMTIVLQHQFWDLIVSDDGFEVGLSFNGVPERLAVPFEAIKGFFDPSVQFALQFEIVEEGVERPAAPAPLLADKPDTKLRRSARPKGGKVPPAATLPAPSGLAAKPGEAEDKPDPPAGGGEVVRLDRFRKK